eukprot:350454-Chlamydomonas_euryale.AAC.5
MRYAKHYAKRHAMRYAMRCAMRCAKRYAMRYAIRRGPLSLLIVRKSDGVLEGLSRWLAHVLPVAAAGVARGTPWHHRDECVPVQASVL